MQEIILILHLLITVGLIGVIMLQRSEGGLGLAGSGMGSFMSGRATANLLTRTTAILATGFMITSLILAIMASQRTTPTSVLETLERQSTTPATAPAVLKQEPVVPSEEEASDGPSVPLAE